jgi:hypothetical protein
MKILKEGKIKEPPQPFWVGIIFSCGCCGTEFQLEAGDEIPYWTKERSIHGYSTVHANCPLCKTHLEKRVIN